MRMSMLKINRHQKYLLLALTSLSLAAMSAVQVRAKDATSVAAGTPAAASSAGAATSPMAVQAALDKELLILENRFFFHHYGHDPIEKRLERIELLTLGGSQFGTNTDRLSRLKAAIVQRDQNAARVMAAQSKSQDKSGAKSDTSYPVLSTLEWRVLKKTYAAESLDQRLDRLETSLFGVPAQAMSYLDRIERLKKTAGVGVDNPAGPYTAIGPGSRTGGGIPRGPMPRAGGGGLNFQTERLFINGKEVPLPNSEMFEGVPDINQFNGMGSGFGSGFPDGINDFKGFPGFSGGEAGTADNIFERFQKPMADILRSFGFSPQMAGEAGSSDESMESPFKRFAVPKGNDTGNQYINEPLPNLRKQPTPREHVPPYSDPNSI